MIDSLLLTKLIIKQHNGIHGSAKERTYHTSVITKNISFLSIGIRSIFHTWYSYTFIQI